MLINMTREPNSQQLSDDDLFEIYLTLFGAETLTTSRLMSICLYLLTQKVQILEEAKAIVKDFDDFGYERAS